MCFVGWCRYKIDSPGLSWIPAKGGGSWIIVVLSIVGGSAWQSLHYTNHHTSKLPNVIITGMHVATRSRLYSAKAVLDHVFFASERRHYTLICNLSSFVLLFAPDLIPGGWGLPLVGPWIPPLHWLLSSFPHLQEIEFFEANHWSLAILVSRELIIVHPCTFCSLPLSVVCKCVQCTGAQDLAILCRMQEAHDPKISDWRPSNWQTCWDLIPAGSYSNAVAKSERSANLWPAKSDWEMSLFQHLRLPVEQIASDCFRVVWSPHLLIMASLPTNLMEALRLCLLHDVSITLTLKKGLFGLRGFCMFTTFCDQVYAHMVSLRLASRTVRQVLRLSPTPTARPMKIPKALPEIFNWLMLQLPTDWSGAATLAASTIWHFLSHGDFNMTAVFFGTFLHLLSLIKTRSPSQPPETSLSPMPKSTQHVEGNRKKKRTSWLLWSNHSRALVRSNEADDKKLSVSSLKSSAASLASCNRMIPKLFGGSASGQSWAKKGRIVQFEQRNSIRLWQCIENATKDSNLQLWLSQIDFHGVYAPSTFWRQIQDCWMFGAVGVASVHYLAQKNHPKSTGLHPNWNMSKKLRFAPKDSQLQLQNFGRFDPTLQWHLPRRLCHSESSNPRLEWHCGSETNSRARAEHLDALESAPKRLTIHPQAEKVVLTGNNCHEAFEPFVLLRIIFDKFQRPKSWRWQLPILRPCWEFPFPALQSPPTS